MQDITQHSLSRRQAEIANLVVAGKSSREIAETLSLSPRTVEHHLEAIFNKLGVGSRRFGDVLHSLVEALSTCRLWR